MLRKRAGLCARRYKLSGKEEFVPKAGWPASNCRRFSLPPFGCPLPSQIASAEAGAIKRCSRACRPQAAPWCRAKSLASGGFSGRTDAGKLRTGRTEDHESTLAPTQDLQDKLRTWVRRRLQRVAIQVPGERD